MRVRETRILNFVRVRLFGLDSQGRPFSHEASTRDISRHGTRLISGQLRNRPGEIIGIRFGAEKARYRVVWIGVPEPGSEPHIGLYCTEPGSYIWDLTPPKSELEIDESSSLKSKLLRMPEALPCENRRGGTRHAAGGGALVSRLGTSAGQWTVLYDLTADGCYLETRMPEPAGTQVGILLQILGLQIQVRGEVTTCDPQVGMGVAFRHITPLNCKRLEHVVGVLTLGDSQEAGKVALAGAESADTEASNKDAGGHEDNNDNVPRPQFC